MKSKCCGAEQAKCNYQGWEELSDAVYSNVDHSLDKDVKDQLIKGECYSQHAAWDYCGYIWFSNNKWHEAVWVYGVEREIKTNETLEDLISEVNDKYGYD